MSEIITSIKRVAAGLSSRSAAAERDSGGARFDDALDAALGSKQAEGARANARNSFGPIVKDNANPPRSEHAAAGGQAAGESAGGASHEVSSAGSLAGERASYYAQVLPAGCSVLTPAALREAALATQAVALDAAETLDSVAASFPVSNGNAADAAAAQGATSTPGGVEALFAVPSTVDISFGTPANTAQTGAAVAGSAEAAQVAGAVTSGAQAASLSTGAGPVTAAAATPAANAVAAEMLAAANKPNADSAPHAAAGGPATGAPTGLGPEIPLATELETAQAATRLAGDGVPAQAGAASPASPASPTAAASPAAATPVPGPATQTGQGSMPAGVLGATAATQATTAHAPAVDSNLAASRPELPVAAATGPTPAEAPAVGGAADVARSSAGVSPAPTMTPSAAVAASATTGPISAVGAAAVGPAAERAVSAAASGVPAAAVETEVAPDLAPGPLPSPGAAPPAAATAVGAGLPTLATGAGGSEIPALRAPSATPAPIGTGEDPPEIETDIEPAVSVPQVGRAGLGAQSQASTADDPDPQRRDPGVAAMASPEAAPLERAGFELPRATGDSPTAQSQAAQSQAGQNTPVSGAERVATQATFAPVAAPAPLPGAPAHAALPPHSQVMQAVGPLLRGADGSYQIALHLDPAGLGRVRVQVEMRGGEVSIHMLAAEGGARDMLRDNLDQLRQQLSEMGLKSGSLDVDAGGADGQNPWESFEAPTEDERRGAAADTGFDAGELVETTEQAIQHGPSDDGALDVRI
ncbi:flagellar hook-length control protein FliK [Gephyromycinifex aptenodytis]|uniref:flagellar hook-length control protein FliK n=1 Tax=Gephyromycinifex aptenodytis TaxID=2716227 RepID=UPI0014477665|nr:flagellar hook-length control protein FliK [Gephyromycinifex aptenodytis]